MIRRCWSTAGGSAAAALDKSGTAAAAAQIIHCSLCRWESRDEMIRRCWRISSSCWRNIRNSCSSCTDNTLFSLQMGEPRQDDQKVLVHCWRISSSCSRQIRNSCSSCTDNTLFSLQMGEPRRDDQKVLEDQQQLLQTYQEQLPQLHRLNTVLSADGRAETR